MAPGPSKKRVFLTNSGTEATEAAIKLARYATGRTAIIAFRGAFHGRTTGAVTLTSSKARQHAGFGPLLPDVHHVPYAYRYRCQFCGDEPACNRGCIGVIEEDLFARHLDPHDVAAIFIEPIQGEGGYVVPPPGYLADLRALCDRYGILLVADEVQSGVGRTGKMFACEHEGVEPDILLTAKGLGSGMPIGAMISRESITTWESGSHGSTFGGNPVCCAAALATLDLVEGGLMANAARLGERLMAGACRLMNKHSCIGDVRGRGLMVGNGVRQGPEHEGAGAGAGARAGAADLPPGTVAAGRREELAPAGAAAGDRRAGHGYRTGADRRLPGRDRLSVRSKVVSMRDAIAAVRA